MFRVLSVGASQAIIEGWLLRQPGMEDVLIDALEPSSSACESARQRVNGTVTHGTWEDAKIEPSYYDAVLCFELVEHVADPHALLNRLSRWCKAHGRVYLSTPDGTFGLGQNPQHLRAYRSVEFADLLRRHGHLENFMVGRDGISVGCYTPRYGDSDATCRGGTGVDVAIFCGGGIKKWSPLDMENDGGLGGSETAAVRLASALTKKGYVVTVYGEVDSGAVGQVVYRHHSAFDPMDYRKATIVSRTPQLLDRRFASEKVLLWLHDADYGDELTPGRLGKADSVMLLSDWQKGHLNLPNVRLTANGIEPAYFPSLPAWGERPNRVIFSSSPDRGLDLLLLAWPRVREKIPDAELVYCYSSVYDEMAKDRPDLAEFRAHLDELADQPGVVNLGSLSHPNLASAMATCRVWAHPSWWSPGRRPFYETYCIGAVEAQAAGCVPVMAPWGALNERDLGEAEWLKDDPLLHVHGLDQRSFGTPSKEDLARTIVRALIQESVSLESARAKALACTWDRTAEDFANAIG
jgi:glycosyltransferase involved in cell wall biosynthesis